jgi:hypothetical protein
MLEVDEAHEEMNVFSSSHLDHQLPESDSTSGKISAIHNFPDWCWHVYSSCNNAMQW